jgi:uncharacterized protein (TIGR02231 family)
MKKIMILVGSLLAVSAAYSAEKEIIKSTITEVTVYAQGAQIYRKANYAIKPGVTEVIIEGICPSIDPNSLQVKATGNVILLDSKYSLFYPKPEPVSLDGIPLKIRKDIHLLQDSLHSLLFEIQEVQDEIDVLVAAKNILANNGAIRGQGKVNDSINLLKQAMEFYSLKMNDLNKKLQVLNRQKHTKNDKKRGMEERLSTLRNYQNDAKLIPKNTGPIHRITITLSAKEVANGKFSISYLVSKAGWTPLYDLRSDVSSGKINLNYKAQVFQNTGMDWDEVRLNISTNNPYQNKTKPSLHPWYVDYNLHRSASYNKDKNTNSVALYNTSPPTAAVQKEAAGGYKLGKDLEEMDAITSNHFTQVIEHMISAEFRIDLPYSISSNNEHTMVLVKNVDLDANYKYYTVPKLDPSVYLVAQLSKLDELQLVPAKANIFFDGSYIGETYLDPSVMEDTLTLSLGRDPNILVKRILLKKDCKERVINNQKEKTFAYQMEIKNLKSTTIDLIVQDQIPITQNSAIVIEPINLDKAKLDAQKGILEWTFNLKSKETKKLNFSYKVQYNKETNLVL